MQLQQVDTTVSSAGYCGYHISLDVALAAVIGLLLATIFVAGCEVVLLCVVY